MGLSYGFAALSVKISYVCALTGHRGRQPVVGHDQGIDSSLRFDGEGIRQADSGGRIELDENSGERGYVEIRSADVNIPGKAGNGDEHNLARSDGVVGNELHRHAGRWG